MDRVVEFWSSVNEPQATIFVGFLTVLAAIIGVLLGSLLFGGRVRDLRGAIDQIEATLKAHVSIVDETLEKVRHDLESLQVELSRTRGDINELDVQQAAPGANEENQSKASPEPELPSLAQFRTSWERVRQELDRRAADLSIDGRTRAKYRRIDRRSYQSLIDLMVWDDSLSDDDAALFAVAWQLWTQYRNGRRPLPHDAVHRMLAVEAAVVG